MKKRNSSIFITFLVTMVCFLSVVYTSCQKTSKNDNTCENINCVNSGICRNGKCLCPYGYEGATCDSGWNMKFAGSWNVHETVTSKDTTGIKVDSLYSITIATATTSQVGTASPTAFFINNMLNNSRYYNISCVVDSTKVGFNFQQGQNIDGGNLIIISGSGSIDAAHNTITGGYIRQHLGATTIMYDTLKFTMTRKS